MAIKDRVYQFIEEFKAEKFVQKNLCDFSWISGSSTPVYPISVYTNSWKSEIVIQWKSDRKCEGFINKMVGKYNDIIMWGKFWKSDGSCPSTITFRLKDAIY